MAEEFVVAKKLINVGGAKGLYYLIMLSTIMRGSDDMIKSSISLQDLRRKLYFKAKAEKTWRFWGVYTHVTKIETLQEAYRLAKRNKGIAGIDNLTFEMIEKQGLDAFLLGIQKVLKEGTYQAQRPKTVQIPKSDGRYRTLKIPTIKDRIVQGALKLILEPIFEADFQPGSYGYRPKRTAHQAVQRVKTAIVSGKSRVIDLDLKAYFDTVKHDKLLAKMAKRLNDPKIMWLLKRILKGSGKLGVPQGGVISPLLSNIYLNEVDKMLERAKEVTKQKGYTHLEYVRFADDLVILVDHHQRWDWLANAAMLRLKQELAHLDVKINVSAKGSTRLQVGQHAVKG